MRWNHNPEPAVVQRGDTRTRVRFLWLPRRIGDETRWLESAAWEQKWDHIGIYPRGFIYGWKDVRWL